MDPVSVIGLILFGAVWLFLAVRIGGKVWKNHFAPAKSVKAQVVDKHELEFFSRYASHQQSKRYVVNFLVDGKKKGFYVSGGSYAGYKVGEKGTLTYQGDKVISFSR
ncbi:MAG: DUF2500 domain-containing protein [Clostridia bacterium]|nr:DUF2500 domain-containing protein [Clostridia bacterium]